MGLAGGLATNGEIGGGGGGGSLEVTDGTTAVSGVTEIDITSGATVTNAGGGIAQVAISGGSGVSSVAAGDGSIVVAGTASAPTIETGTLDVIATDHPPAAAWSNNSKKITGLANGTAATDAAAFGQILSNPMTTADDMIIGGASGAPARLAIGSNGEVLTVVSGAPAWASATLSPTGPGGTAGANTGAAQTIPSPTTFNQWWGVMNAATVTITLPAGVAGGLFQVRLDQDATGGRVLAFAANPVFPGYASAAAALAKINAQSAAAAEIWITFVCVDGTSWQAFPALPQGRAVVSVTSGASITPALQGPQDHIFVVSALAAAMTVNAITGSPVDGQKVEFRLAQNGTGGFAITWNAAFTTANTALITWPAEPTTASATWKELYEWNASTSKWERMAMV